VKKWNGDACAGETDGVMWTPGDIEGTQVRRCWRNIARGVCYIVRRSS